MTHSVKTALPNMARTIAAGTIWRYRIATAPKRCLPHFLIIGSQKSGTTSLYSYLRRHPQIVPAFKKEVHFFDGGLKPNEDSYEKGVQWYQSHFPLRSKVKANQLTFEASPLYMFNPLAPQRIKSKIPNVKLIAILRNPTERAISHYFHECRKQRESLPIDEAMRVEEVRLQRTLETKDYKNSVFMHRSYKARGRYYEQLQRYLSIFPKEQMLMMSAEDLFERPEICMQQVFEFVGVEPDSKLANFKPKNVGGNRSYIPKHVYDYLDNYFKIPNQDLFNMLGKNYHW